jgi:hypothetical protein
MNLKSKLLLIAFFIASSFSSCGIYSFTGASISPDVKTISIQTFFNNAPLGPPNMSISFTEKIKDYYQQNTSLSLINDEGDLQLEGSIENYTLTPVAATASQDRNGIDLTSLTRITITVTVTYLNVQDETYDFSDKRFTFFKDFDQNTEDLSTNEEAFVDEIFEQIVLDIFNSSVANW